MILYTEREKKDMLEKTIRRLYGEGKKIGEIASTLGVNYEEVLDAIGVVTVD